jgi:hypothetical protein
MAVSFSPELPAAAVAALGRRDEARGGEPEVSDRVLGRSWGRRPHDAYEGYDDLWPTLAADFSELTSWCAANGVPEPSVTGCELTYTNPVMAGEGWQQHGQLERLVVQWLGQQLAGDFLPSPADVVAGANFQFPAGRGGVAGTLTVTLRAMSGEGPEPLMGLTLSARGAVEGPGLEEAKAFFDNAFEWVVRACASLVPVAPQARRRAPALVRRAPALARLHRPTH